jgi:hypothetical protein
MHISFIRGQMRNQLAAICETQIVDVESFARSFIADHPNIEGPDSDFYRAVTFEFLRAEAKALIGRWNPSPRQRDQGDLFSGYEHLQKAYPVERNGRRLLVPAPMMTEAEWDQKERELLSMADGCLAHRKEIIRYRSELPRSASA